MSEEVDRPEQPRILSGSFPPAPRPLALVAALVLVAGLVMTMVGAGRAGLSVDEAGHVNRLEAFIHEGLYVRDGEREGAGDDGIPPNAYVYAPGTALIMHAVNTALGTGTLGQPSDSATAYTVRHYVVAAMSVVGLLAVFGLAWLLLGGWRWGLIAAATLAAIPMWTGHSMFNPKDTPVAVGYTLLSFALAGLATTTGLSGRSRRRWAGLATVGMVLGIALAMGTRPGIWPGVLAAVVVSVGLLAAARAIDRWFLVGLGAGLLGGYAALLVIYPRVYSHPLAMLRMSLGQTMDFASGSDAPDRTYVFERTLIEWPLLLLAFLLVGTVIAAVLSFRLLGTDAPRAVAAGVLGAQAFALPLAAVITKSNLYDGLRQLLFAVPAEAVLATVGIAAVIARARGTVRPALTWLTVAIAGAALVLPTVVQARLFPYQYGYGNVAAEALGGEILNDKWRVSFKEHVEEIPPTIKAICPHNTPKHGPIIDTATDCRGGWGVVVPPWLAYWHHARYDPDSPLFYLVQSADKQRPVPTNCALVQEAVRHRNLTRVMMSRLLLCTSDGTRPRPDAVTVPHPKTIPTPLDRVVKIDHAKLPDRVVAYGASRGTPVYGASVEDALELHKPGDVRRMKGAPDDFKDFIRRTIVRDSRAVVAELKRRDKTLDSAHCDFAVQIRLWGVGPGVATGRVRGCDRDSFDVIWAQRDGRWRQVDRMQGGWDCATLDRYRVPAAITAATCWYGEFRDRPYDGPR